MTAVVSGKPYMVVCEDELDTVVASSVCGLNAIGMAGVSHWKHHRPGVLRGFRDVFVVTNNDDKEGGSNQHQHPLAHHPAVLNHGTGVDPSSRWLPITMTSSPHFGSRRSAASTLNCDTSGHG